MLAKKKQESANYDAEIKKAKQEASVAKALLQQEQKQLKQLQAKAQQGNTAAATGTSKPAPSFFISAGAKLTVILFGGN